MSADWKQLKHSEKLKEAIEIALDKVFLAYLELKE